MWEIGSGGNRLPLTYRMSQPADSRAAPRRLHAPFLERAGEPVDQELSSLALGAFLTLRAVDQLSARHNGHEALQYQVNALDSFLADIDTAAPDLAHLKDIAVGIRQAAQGDFTLLWGPLAEFCGWLEGEFRLEEALDVIDTALATAEGHDRAVIPHLKLQHGRILRRAGRFDDATEAYAAAGRAALAAGDGHTELLSRIGRGIVLQQVGNLPAAKTMLSAARDDAERAGDRDAEARANHDLAATAIRARNPGEAVPLAFRAFERYESPTLKLRALGDLGLAMFQLGHFRAAKDAQELVVDGATSMGMRATALIELLAIGTAMHDRISFERVRRQIDGLDASLPPDWSVDYHIKLGTGLSRFGQTEAARSYLNQALSDAERFGLNEYLFTAEDALRALDRAEEAEKEDAATPTTWQDSTEGWSEVAEVAAALHHLRVS